MEEFIAPEERIQHQEALRQLDADRLRLMKEYATQQQILGKMNSLKDSQNKLTGALSSLANVIIEEADLKNYEVQLDNLQKQKNIIPMASTVVKLENELKALDDQLQKSATKLPDDADVETLISDEQISSAILSQKQYDENVNACKKLQLQYDSEVLANEIQRLTGLLDSQPRIQTLNKLFNVYKQYLPFQQITGTISECDDAITLKREEIQRLSATLNVLKCPACTHPLRIMGNTLVKADCQPASSAEIEQAKRQLEELNLKKRRVQERDNLQREFKNMQSLAGSEVPTASVAELPAKDILAYKTRIAEISKIKVLTAPTVSASLLTQVANYQKLYLKKLSLEENLHKIRGTVPLEALELANLDLKTIDNKIVDIKKKLSASQEVKTRRKTLEQQLSDAMAQLSNLSIDLTVKDRLDETIQTIDRIKQQLLASEKIDVFISRQSNLETRHQEVLTIFEELTALQTLKAKAVEVECQVLQTTVDSINLVLSDIATRLFDDPITISLSLFKTLKSKDRVKPTVNLSINYRGGEYDNITQLSGGEGDRISLAITIALARLNSSPFLLLDECMASLDADLKECSVDVLRHFLGNTKTIISVLHEGTEGYFDDIISLENKK